MRARERQRERDRKGDRGKGWRREKDRKRTPLTENPSNKRCHHVTLVVGGVRHRRRHTESCLLPPGCQTDRHSAARPDGPAGPRCNAKGNSVGCNFLPHHSLSLPPVLVLSIDLTPSVAILTLHNNSERGNSIDGRKCSPAMCCAARHTS